jgi:hypothetical protein
MLFFDQQRLSQTVYQAFAGRSTVPEKLFGQLFPQWLLLKPHAIFARLET